MVTTSDDRLLETASRLRLAIVRTARRMRQEAGTDISPTLTAALGTIDRRGARARRSDRPGAGPKRRPRVAPQHQPPWSRSDAPAPQAQERVPVTAPARPGRRGRRGAGPRRGSPRANARG